MKNIPSVNTEEISDYIKNIIESNNSVNKKLPICIWGKPGYGKTDIVEQIANDIGYEFISVPIGQFQEMGDLQGLPIKMFPMLTPSGKQTYVPEIEISMLEKRGWSYDLDRSPVTKCMKPEFVPDEKVHGEKGILLLDDVNRTTYDILNGIMQLLQNGELVSWKLPKGWHIVLTANPDNGNFNVSTMDEALITRCSHLNINFDINSWVKWAHENNLHSSCIQFASSNKELMEGINKRSGKFYENSRINPRTISHVFSHSKIHIDKYIQSGYQENKCLEHIRTLGFSTVGIEFTEDFITYLRTGIKNMILPTDIINANSVKLKKIKTEISLLKKKKRIDILNLIIMDLEYYLLRESEELNKSQYDNLIEILTFGTEDNTGFNRDLITSFWTSLCNVKKRRDYDSLSTERLKQISKITSDSKLIDSYK